MIVVIQRVLNSKCIINEKLFSEIDKGIVAFIAIEKDDKEEDYDYCIKKILNLRIFENEENKFDKSIIDINGEIMVISQFTLAGTIHKGNRPSFDNAMEPSKANIEFEKFLNKLKEKYNKIKVGIFGEFMLIDLKNIGPVTFIIDSKKRL
jgi:D-tyrosyl-tRNA(Tyr) deacylase